MASAVLQAVAVPWLAYAVILVLLTVDAFVPVVPTQALMIGGGLLAASGELRLCLVVAAGVLGALAGDTSSFALGRRLAGRAARLGQITPGRPGQITPGRLGQTTPGRPGQTTPGLGQITPGRPGQITPGRLGKPRRPRKIHRLTGWLTGAMQRHAFLAMLFCRFVPAGRMAASAYAGRSGFALRRFLRLDLAAATLWATYAGLLGRFGGEALASSSWLPLALVGAVALLLVAAGPIASLASKARTH